MSDLNNPLFDDEKEFLERKKLEYERALAADVESLKEQSLTVGKIAAVGAGAVTGIWLLSKLFGGPKKPRERKPASKAKKAGKAKGAAADPGFYPAAEYYTDGLGVRHRAVAYHKSAAQSAAAFQEDERLNGSDEPEEGCFPAHVDDRDHDRADDGGFGAGFGTDETGANETSSDHYRYDPDHHDPDTIGAEVFASAYAAANTPHSLKVGAESAKKAGVQPAQSPRLGEPAKKPAVTTENDPFAEAPVHETPAHDKVGREGGNQMPGLANFAVNSIASRSAAARSLVGVALNNFLQSETGRVLLAQAGAVALAAVTKQLSKVFPKASATVEAPHAGIPAATIGKNADLAAASAVALSETAARHPETAASSDDSLTPSQPLA